MAVVTEYIKISTGGDADVIVHASGNTDGLATALELAGFEATVAELSWFGTSRAEIPLGERFHSRRLTIKSSQVGHVSPSRRARWDAARRMALVMRLLEAPELDALISAESPFESLPEVMRSIATGRHAGTCHRITYL